MEFKLPDFDTVLEVHHIVISIYGGLTGEPHTEYIEAALTRPQNYMAYDGGCDIHLVAALVLDSIARNHGFADGNKRTALITMLMVYNLNGYRLDYSLHMNERFEQLVLRVTQTKPSIKSLRLELQALITEFSV